MLCICFHIGEQAYAIRASSVERVLPRMSVTSVAHAPAWFLGVINICQQGVPLLDFCMLLHERPSRPLFSTRIILLHCQDRNGTARMLGLLAEGVTGTLQFRMENAHHLELSLRQAPYLAEVVTDDRGMVQLIDANGLFNEEVAALLERHANATAA